MARTDNRRKQIENNVNERTMKTMKTLRRMAGLSALLALATCSETEDLLSKPARAIPTSSPWERTRWP